MQERHIVVGGGGCSYCESCTGMFSLKFQLLTVELLNAL